MTVTIYSGNTSTAIGTFTLVNTATINKDGSISLTQNLSNPEGKDIKTFGPHANKIVIERAYNET